MSAKLKIIPKDQRLQVIATIDHQTLRFGGNIFEFIEHCMREKMTGVGRFGLNKGGHYFLEFELKVDKSQILIDNQS